MVIRKVLIALITVLLSVAAVAQDDDYMIPEKRQRGFVFTMAESGSGLGGFYMWPLSSHFHFGATFDAFSLRDANEISFYDYYSGYPITINKQNNVYIFDLFFTVKKRFFAEDMDESFRPFLTAAAGPVFGMNFPEFSRTPSGKKTSDEYRWTLGGFVGGGVDFTVSPNYFLSFRAQYRIMPFTKILGERENHSMFEIRIEIGQRF